MSNPITNFELGKMKHRENEAQASMYWGQGAPHTLSKGYKMLLAFMGIGLTSVLVVLMLML